MAGFNLKARLQPKKICLPTSAGSVQGCARNIFSNPKVLPFETCGCLNRFPVTVWLEASFGVSAPRRPAHSALLSCSGCCPPLRPCARPGRIRTYNSSHQCRAASRVGGPCGFQGPPTAVSAPCALPASPCCALGQAGSCLHRFGRRTWNLSEPCGLQGARTQEL